MVHCTQQLPPTRIKEWSDGWIKYFKLFHTRSPSILSIHCICLLTVFPPFSVKLNKNCICIGRFLFESRKTKEIALSNCTKHRQSTEPIKNGNRHSVADAKRGKTNVRARHDWFWFHFWLDEKVARNENPAQRCKSKSTEPCMRSLTVVEWKLL